MALNNKTIIRHINLNLFNDYINVNPDKKGFYNFKDILIFIGLRLNA